MIPDYRMLKRQVVLCLCAVILLSALSSKAQDTKKALPLISYHLIDSTKKLKKDTNAQTDLYTLIGHLFHKGGANASSGAGDSITTKPTITILPAAGYTLTTGLAGTLTGNVAFRTGPEARVSAITSSIGFTQKSQFTLPIISNIWSPQGDYVFVGDFRFYRYPLSTFGLGSGTHAAAEDPMRFNLLRFYETALRRVAPNFYLGAGYSLDIHGHITEEGPENGTPSAYQLYGAAARTVSSSITFNALFDSRDNSINAYHGFYTSVQYRDAYSFLGSTSAYRTLVVDVRKYFNLPAGSDNVLAFWNYDWVVLSGKPPYLDLPSTGWDSYSCIGRGYVQGRFRGAQMVYFESEYRYKITHNGLLGGVVFVNAQSLSAQPGTALQTIQPGFGPGLRLMVNKTSKTHIAVDYGFGTEGSHGLFVNVGEVF